MKKLLLLLFSILISFNSYGEWTKVNEDVDGDSYYIDFETVKEIDGYVVWWEMRDYLKPDDGNMSTQSYQKGDCEASRITYLSLIFYTEPMGNGESEQLGGGIINLEDIIGWKYPPPDSVSKSILDLTCLLADQSSMNNYQSKVLELIAEFESYEWDDDSSYSSSSKSIPPNAYASGNSWKCNSGYERYNNGCRKDELFPLKSAYVNNIAARVKTFWRFQGADNDWRCDVYVQQKRNGEVISTEVKNCNTGDSSKARGFKNSIERAVWKSAPLPAAPDDAVFDSEITFTFSTD